LRGCSRLWQYCCAFDDRWCGAVCGATVGPARTGGFGGATFTWGNEAFPWRNFLSDGYDGTSSVGRFPANGYVLHDMAGWLGTGVRLVGLPPCGWHHRGLLWPVGQSARRLAEGRLRTRATALPYPSPSRQRWFASRRAEHCLRCRPAARQRRMIDTGMSQIGFHCVVCTPRATRARAG